MTTITLSNRLSRPFGSPPTRRGLLLGFVGTLLLGLIVTAAISVGIAATSSGRVLPGVRVAGVELAGLDREAAAARLSEALPSLSAGTATVVVDGDAHDITYEELGRRHDTEAMVETAFAVGDSGNPLADGLSRLRNLANPVSLPVIVHAYDSDALDRLATQIANEVTADPVDAAVTRDGTTFTVSESVTGRSIQAAAVAEAIGSAVENAEPADVRVELTTTPIEPAVGTEDAEAVAEAARNTVAALPLEIAGAAPDEEMPSIAPETIASWLTFGPAEGDGAYALHLDEAAALAAVEALVATVNQDPVNAQITVADGGGLGGVVPAQDGRALDVEKSADGLLAALDRRGAGESVASLALAVNVTQPAVTTAHAQSILPQMQMISSWTTYYVPGEGNGFGNNINIGAFDIDGRNMAPGEWFSFWGSIGPVTVERGYSYGGAIINGRSTQGVAIGGGICSTSTTIFNAALRAGLEMGERLNHYYYIDRYPDGLDATVSIMDDWTQDMTFRNDTENPIVIRGFGGNGSVTFQVWSVPLERTVVITDPVTSNHRKATDTTEVVASMAPGTSKRVEYPHDGHDVSRSRFVYDAAGNLLHQNDYFSSYATVNGIVQVGPRAAAAEPPADEEGA